ncbi:MAG: arylsulfotransferase family protein [Solirubrobacterales bacterium]
MSRLNGRSTYRAATVSVLAIATALLVTGSGSGSGATGEAGASEATVSAKGPYVTQPRLDPPKMVVKKNTSRASREKIFVGSKVSGAAIYSSKGDPIWFLPSRSMDFRTQKYRGRPVLTWFQAPSPGNNLKRNTYMIANRSYKIIKRVYPGNGYSADSHEFRLTNRGTAFVTSYATRYANLSSVGLGTNAAVNDSIAQEIDIRTGRVLWQWNSLSHVPIRDTYAEKPRHPGNPFDYFHINSVIDTPDGNIMISGRSTNAIYKVSRRTGKIIWTLGGKSSDFRMGNGAYFSSQHDAEPHGRNQISLFDNGDSPVISKPVRSQSRGLVLKLNYKKKTARVHREFFNPAKPLASQQANVQKLRSGKYFVGWGGVPLISEHAAGGKVLFDAELKGINSFYRAYRGKWNGKPKTKVSLVARRADGGRTRFWASWNGDSKVTKWRVLTGRSKNSLKKARVRKRDGFETTSTVPGNKPWVKVVGLDAKNRKVGSSRVVRAG